MDAITIVQIISGVIFSVACSGGIVWFFVQLSANTLAENYKKKIEHDFEKKIEGYKSQLEILRVTTLKYNDKQFELFIDLWKKLQELKFICIDLWIDANKQNLKKFNMALHKTFRQVETSSILIDEEQYKDLINVITNFQEYDSGKKKLVAEWNSAEVFEIEEMIEHNRQRKEICLQIIDRMKNDIRNKIKGI